jgi:hypothetical protein
MAIRVYPSNGVQASVCLVERAEVRAPEIGKG